MHPAHYPNDILVSCLKLLLLLWRPVCMLAPCQTYHVKCTLLNDNIGCFQKNILSHRFGLCYCSCMGTQKVHYKAANCSFTQCDSRKSSPVLLARHQSHLEYSHWGDKDANLMEGYKHQQRITGIIVIAYLP